MWRIEIERLTPLPRPFVPLAQARECVRSRALQVLRLNLRSEVPQRGFPPEIRLVSTQPPCIGVAKQGYHQIKIRLCHSPGHVWSYFEFLHPFKRSHTAYSSSVDAQVIGGEECESGW